MNQQTDEGVTDRFIDHSPTAKVITLNQGSITLIRGYVPSTQGDIEPGRHLKVGLCLSAGGSVQIGSGPHAARRTWRKGETFITPPTDDSIFTSPDVEMLGLAVDLSHKDFIAEPARSVDALHDRPSFISDDAVISSILSTLWVTAQNGPASGPFFKYSALMIIDRILAMIDPAKTEIIQNPPLSRRQQQRIEDYIDANLSLQIRTSDLARAAGLSQAKFAQALKATANVSPYAYLTAARFKRAQTLLLENWPVTQISLAVGYANPSKFSAAFKRRVGCTPLEWKRRKQDTLS